MRKGHMQFVAEDFEGLIEAIEAKRRMMTRWKGDGVIWAAAVVKYADEQQVSVEHAAERVDDMELLTGIRLERN